MTRKEMIANGDVLYLNIAQWHQLASKTYEVLNWYSLTIEHCKSVSLATETMTHIRISLE